MVPSLLRELQGIYGRDLHNWDWHNLRLQLSIAGRDRNLQRSRWENQCGWRHDKTRKTYDPYLDIVWRGVLTCKIPARAPNLALHVRAKILA
jgi:hypothetical protein